MKSNLPELKDLFGFINVFKPRGITSHDVVSRLRKALKIKQIGHTGTLDPLAEGVLPVAIGKATRLIEYLDEGKGYIASLQFGKVSDTYDTEGNVTDFSDKKVPKEEIINTLAKFQGEIEQIPPAYSAVHYNGKRLYELAREGNVPVDIPKRTVFVEKIDLVEFDEQNQTAQIEVECSKGTYIRSIVHDLGQELGCGAVMFGLLRTRAGKFTVDNAVKLDDITDLTVAEKYLHNPVEVLSYKSYRLTDEELNKVKHGQWIVTKDYDENEIVCLVYNNKLCAIAQKSEGKLLTKKVFI